MRIRSEWLTTVMTVVVVACALYVITRAPDRMVPYPTDRRVCVLMFSTPNIVEEYAGIAATINEAYARKHGYEFVHRVGPNTHSSAAWEKVRLFNELIDQYDAVFWIDSDAAFNQHDTPLDKWLDMDEDIVGCTDSPNGHYKINCGVVLVKNTEWSRGFLKKWWAMEDLPKYNKWAFEQEAMHDLVTGDVDACVSEGHIKIEPVDAFNSNINQLMGGDTDMFVTHFMAQTTEVRIRELQKVARRVLS